MKKPVFFGILLILLVFLLAACRPGTQVPTDPSAPEYAILDTVSPVEPAKNEKGAYVLTAPGHVAYMAEHPGETYILGADIDMGGAGWTPIAEFSGKLDGKIHGNFAYTISNLTIQAPKGAANIGFFASVTGEVKNLIFKDIHVVSRYLFTGNLGVVAGQSTQALENIEAKNCTLSATVMDANVGTVCGRGVKTTVCTASGLMQIHLAGGKSYVGGILGYAQQAASSLDSRMEMHITGKASGAAGGLVGYAGGTVGFVSGKNQNPSFGGKLTVSTDSAFAAGTLVGELNGTLDKGQNCAEVNAVTGARQQADGYCGILGANGKLTNCVTRDPQTLEGLIPAAEYTLRKQVVDYMYTLSSFRWTTDREIYYNCDCNHPQTYLPGTVYFGAPYAHMAISLQGSMAALDPDGSLKAELPSHIPCDFFGNDCADAIYWAYSEISAKVNYVLTRDCLSRLGTNGLIPVGSYKIAGTTEAICAANGQQAMFEAYAQVKLGDSLLTASPGGHIRMAAENAYVFRKANGTIDPIRSYILQHEQGVSTSKLPQNHSTSLVYGKYTFQQLFATGYIPVTLVNFTQGEDKIEVSTTNTATDRSGVCAGTVRSNYRLNSVTVTITDSTGAAVMEKTVFVPNDNKSNTVTYDLSGFRAQLDRVSLTSGQTYTYEVLVLVSGEAVSVQSFQFTA